MERPIADSRLMAWRLAPSRRVLVPSPAFLARHRTPSSVADLDGHRGIFYANRGLRTGALSGRMAPRSCAVEQRCM
jgi:DNA-binding transcriptional LysR family regulator